MKVRGEGEMEEGKVADDSHQEKSTDAHVCIYCTQSGTHKRQGFSKLCCNNDFFVLERMQGPFRSRSTVLSRMTQHRQ